MQPRRLRRWLSVGGLACVVVVIAGLALREWLLAEALLRHVERLSQPREFATTRADVPGTFNACLSGTLAAEPVPRVLLSGPPAGVPPESIVARERVLSGDAPLDSLAERDRAALAEAMAWAEHVLRCARSPRLGPDAHVGPFSDYLDSPLRVAVGSLPRAAGLAIRGRLEAGEVAQALELCLDAAAFARAEMSLGVAAEGGGMRLLRGVARSCAEAIDEASPEAKQRLVAELRLVSSSTPNVAEALDIMSAQVQLALYARLTKVQAARLPHGHHPEVAMFNLGALKGAVLHLQWHSTARAFEARIAAAVMPAAARDAELVKIEERYASMFTDWVGIGSSAGWWVGSAQENDQAHALLAFMVRVARVDLGEEPWPPGASLTFEGDVPIEVVLHRD